MVVTLEVKSVCGDQANEVETQAKVAEALILPAPILDE